MSPYAMIMRAASARALTGKYTRRRLGMEDIVSCQIVRFDLFNRFDFLTKGQKCEEAQIREADLFCRFAVF